MLVPIIIFSPKMDSPKIFINRSRNPSSFNVSIYFDVLSLRSWNADPDRPKNDKATILADTIQLLKDLTSQVNKLKAEYATLTEESREVILSFLSLR